jgi:hypothetical protein
LITILVPLYYLISSSYNVVYQRAGHITERATFPHFPTSSLKHVFSLTLIMQIQTNKARIILVIKVVRSSSKISIRRAATLYKIPRSSFGYKLAGRTSCNKTEINYHKLTEIEKEMIIRYILDLDTRGFAPRLASIKNITNYILES